MTAAHKNNRPNKTDAGNGSKAICRASNVLRSPSPDPCRSAEEMNIRMILWLLVALLAIPPILNLLGLNVFLYVGSDSLKLVIAASQGLCHLATTSETKDVSDYLDYLPEFTEIHMEILKFGPIELFSEKRIDPMQWFRFGVSSKSDTFDYSAVEFPWVLLPLAPLVTLCLKRKKKK